MKGPIAYPLALALKVKVPDVFHVSLLNRYFKYVKGEFHLELQCILQRNILMLQNSPIEQFKVKWKHFRPNEATWEMEDQMWAMYASLFTR